MADLYLIDAYFYPTVLLPVRPSVQLYQYVAKLSVVCYASCVGPEVEGQIKRAKTIDPNFKLMHHKPRYSHGSTFIIRSEIPQPRGSNPPRDDR